MVASSTHGVKQCGNVTGNNLLWPVLSLTKPFHAETGQGAGKYFEIVQLRVQFSVIPFPRAQFHTEILGKTSHIYFYISKIIQKASCSQWCNVIQSGNIGQLEKQFMGKGSSIPIKTWNRIQVIKRVSFPKAKS